MPAKPKFLETLKTPVLTIVPHGKVDDDLDRQISQAEQRIAKLKRLIALQKEAAGLECVAFQIDNGDLRLERVLEVVSKHYHVTREQLLGRAHCETIVWPRHVGMFLSRTVTEFPTSELGKFWHRSHGAISHAIRHVTDRRDVDPQIRTELLELEARCRADSASPLAPKP